MHRQHTGRDGRQRPFEERTRHDQDQQAGGRSERPERPYRQERRPTGQGPERGWRESEAGWRDDRWRADDSFSEPSEYYEPTRYEPGGFPQGLRPDGVRDGRSERDLREPRHRSELGQRLEDAGRRLVGKVRRLVRNPKNYKRSDERIREDICDRLSVSAEVDPSEIEVSVSAGEVTLMGYVADRQMKFAAEDITDDVPGVHEIHNQLRVTRQGAEAANSNAQPQPELPATTKRN
jgi:hypothetical protein